MDSLRLLREARGLSQRSLARLAGLSFRTLQLLESGRHDPRWSSVVKLARALGLKPGELAPSLGARGFTPVGEDSVRDCSLRVLKDGEASWKVHLMDLLDGLRRDPAPRLMEDAPDPRVGRRVMALMAAMVSALCAQKRLPAPWWCAGVGPLREPWFVSSSESLKASALIEAPAQFRQRNIFTLGNFLMRA